MYFGGFIESVQQKEEQQQENNEIIKECSTCNNYYEIRDQFENNQSNIFPQDQIFLFSNDEISKSSSYKQVQQKYVLARLIKVLDCKQAERYQAMNLLVLNENSQLQVISLFSLIENQEELTFNAISKMLLPLRLYCFVLFTPVGQNPIYMIQYKQYSDEPVIKGAPVVIHQNTKEKNFPQWMDLKIDLPINILNDQNLNIIHKTYNIVGILKHFSVKILPNFEFSDQNAEGILDLLDCQMVPFKARIWGEYKQLSNLKIKDIILLKNFKIDYTNANCQCVQICTMGYSMYEQNPFYLNPMIKKQLDQISKIVFHNNIQEYLQSNSASEIIITDCLIHSFDWCQVPYIIFQDIQGQLIQTIIEDSELLEKIKNENLQDYYNVYLNIIIKQKIQFSQEGEPKLSYVLVNLN